MPGPDSQPELRKPRVRPPSLLAGRPAWILSSVVFFIVSALALTPCASAQATTGVESSPQLFAVMCALHAAGYESEVGAAGIHPVRAQLRGEMLRLQGPAAEALRKFYREHLVADSAANLSRYVSFALIVGPPPRFEFLLRRAELPPDVLTLERFNEILADFYREAQIEQLWNRMQPAYQREIRRLQEPVGQIVLVATSYLREVPRPTRTRSFVVNVEPLVGGKVNFRSYNDTYSVVLSPTAELPLDDIRHAYLHFLLDPLAIRYRQSVARREVLLRYVGRAARLGPEYRDDFPALLTECLVRAVELRLRRLPPASLAAAIDEAEQDGYILVRPFVERLAEFEKAEPAMTFYYPDLINGIDVAKEARRLEKVQFAAAEAAREMSTAPQESAESEMESWLREGELRIASKDGPGAAAWFEKALGKYPGLPRAMYGLGVAKILQGQGEEAKALFLQLVAAAPRVGASAPPAPDPVILAWSHVYLGRIHDVEGNRELALSEYRAALAVEGAPEAARLAARRSIEKGFEPARSRPEAQPQRP